MAGKKSEIAGDERVVLCIVAAAEHLALKTGFSVTSKAKGTGLLVSLLCCAPGETMYACEMALASSWEISCSEGMPYTQRVA